MTMPHLMNCPHDGEGWCLDCAKSLAADRDALLKFKTWVHDYLDSKGIPTHPGGPHSKEGCRIGDRMDLVFAELDRLREAMKPFATWKLYDNESPSAPLAVRGTETRITVADVLKARTLIKEL